jgi:hypothetical protein
MPIIDLPQGRVQYRLAGPKTSARPPVVFVRGLLVNCGGVTRIRFSPSTNGNGWPTKSS